MAITVPNVINNISSSQIVTQSGQACVPANLLDQNFSALANPVNPVISIAGSISLSTSNSGNIYELNAPSSNATITLPTPTNGFNVIFVGNNSSSYTYTFSTPSGNIIWNNTTSANVTPNTTSGVYFLVSDGTNYILNSYSDITGVTAGIYGDLLDIPQITVDSKGRIKSATTNPVRVDLTNASSDYNLQVGQLAYISFSNATSVPLHIATSSGTSYELYLASSNNMGTSGATAGGILLNPNNTTYSSAFLTRGVYVSSSGSASGTAVSYSSFYIGFGLSHLYAKITNITTAKTVVTNFVNWGDSNDIATIDIFANSWNDTTTAWTSLGTITFPQSTSGYVLVRRLQ
jgi:hypothetical protein